MIYLIFFILLSRAEAHEYSFEQLKEVSQSKTWLRLLHYKDYYFQGKKSAVAGGAFFLDPKGGSDSLLELEATIKALTKGGGEYGKLKQSAYCAFPARRIFLEKELGLKFPEEECKDWNLFLERLDPAGISLEYATAYSGNPASMFGHSFFKIRGRKNAGKAGRQIDLLDWSINYAAGVPPDENGFAFVWFGVTGGYKGQFTIAPFYAKIEEYGISEGRDIWEYDLNLNESELKMLLMATWEIETLGYFNYFFFDENCSYQLLALLEIAKPEWDLSGYFLHMIPGESVRKVAKAKNAIKSVQMKPSLERQVKFRLASLAENERKSFNELRDGSAVGGPTGAVLDVYLLYLMAEKKRKGESWANQEEARFRETLIARSQFKEAERSFSYGGELTRPDLAHGPYRIGIGAFSEGSGRDQYSGAELSLHFAYHSLLDPDPGYMPHSEFLFPHFKFRYYQRDKKIYFDDGEFIAISALNPWNIVRNPISWRANIKYVRLMENKCFGCRTLQASGAVGAAWSVNSERWTVFSLWGAEQEAGVFARTSLFWNIGSLWTLYSRGKLLWDQRLLRSWEWRGGALYRWQSRWGVFLPVGDEKGILFHENIELPLQSSSRLENDTSLSFVKYF